MKIKVDYLPSNHKVKLWWFKANKPGVKGIAEWQKLD